jgi:hypothetical protein
MGGCFVRFRLEGLAPARPDDSRTGTEQLWKRYFQDGVPFGSTHDTRLLGPGRFADGRLALSFGPKNGASNRRAGRLWWASVFLGWLTYLDLPAGHDVR